jgi:membrane protein involved in D-alanine export
MIPFADFLYFGASLYVLIPNLIFGWIKRISKTWIVIATGVMLVLQYGVLKNVLPNTSMWDLWVVLGYAAAQFAIAAIFLAIRRRKANRYAFYTAILLSSIPLLLGKYLPLFQPSYGLVFIGLSYVTFRSLDVLIGIQDGLITALNPIQYLVFLLFFASISSGPIDRYQRFNEDWRRDRSQADFMLDLDGGIQRVMTGFLYKFILAELIRQYWMDPAAAAAGFWPNVSYMYAYTLYLFFDFAGYSAFAVGFCYFFGIHTPENFNRPFLSRNIRDFWNRWHISLSTWFRDHVYSRFVMSAIKGHWFKSKYTASYLGYFLSMGLMGIWHGTAWNYLIYGLYHATLLILNDVFDRLNKKYKWLPKNNPAWDVFSIVVTMHLVCFGLLIFSGKLG